MRSIFSLLLMGVLVFSFFAGEASGLSSAVCKDKTCAQTATNCASGQSDITCPTDGATCSGAGTTCTGKNAACLYGATCSYNNPSGKVTYTGNTTNDDESNFSGYTAKCNGVGTTCTGDGAYCTNGATCTGKQSGCDDESICQGKGSICVGNVKTTQYVKCQYAHEKHEKVNYSIIPFKNNGMESQQPSKLEFTDYSFKCIGKYASCLSDGSYCTDQATCSGDHSGCDEGATCTGKKDICYGKAVGHDLGYMFTNCKGSRANCYGYAACSNCNSTCHYPQQDQIYCKSLAKKDCSGYEVTKNVQAVRQKGRSAKEKVGKKAEEESRKALQTAEDNAPVRVNIKFDGKKKGDI